MIVLEFFTAFLVTATMPGWGLTTHWVKIFSWKLLSSRFVHLLCWQITHNHWILWISDSHERSSKVESHDDILVSILGVCPAPDIVSFIAETSIRRHSILFDSLSVTFLTAQSTCTDEWRQGGKHCLHAEMNHSNIRTLLELDQKSFWCNVLFCVWGPFQFRARFSSSGWFWGLTFLPWWTMQTRSKSGVGRGPPAFCRFPCTYAWPPDKSSMSRK